MKKMSLVAMVLFSISSYSLASETGSEKSDGHMSPKSSEMMGSEKSDDHMGSKSEMMDSEKSEGHMSSKSEMMKNDASAENISRSTFTNGVENREPIDKVGQLTNNVEKVYFFTEIKGMSGKTVTHRWEHAGNIKAEVSFKVGSDRWRVWSSKNLQPGWVGEWIVSVVDDQGNTLTEESMAYVPAEKMVDETQQTPDANTTETEMISN